MPAEALLRLLNRQNLDSRFPAWSTLRDARDPDETGDEVQRLSPRAVAVAAVAAWCTD